MNLVETDKEGKPAATFVAVAVRVVVDDGGVVVVVVVVGGGGGGGGGGRTQDFNGITSIHHWSDFSRA